MMLTPSLIFLFCLVNSLDADVKVNLINPLVIGAEINGQCGNSSFPTGCNINIYTNAAKYELSDIDWKNGTTGKIRRSGKWESPNKEDPQPFYYRQNAEKVIFLQQQKEVQLTTDSYALFGRPEQYMNQLDASLNLKNRKVRLLIRDNLFRAQFDGTKDVCNNNQTCASGDLNVLFMVSSNKMKQKLRYWAPISAYILKEVPGADFFHLIAFDESGRAIYFKMTFTENKGKPKLRPEPEATLIFDMSSIVNPLSKKTSVDNWAKKELLFGNNLKEALEKNLLQKLQVTSLDTVSTIFNQASDGLCISRGIIDLESKTNSFECLSKGKKVVRTPLFDSLPSNSTLIVHASYMGNHAITYHNYSSITHVVYSYSSSSDGEDGEFNLNYLFCNSDDPFIVGADNEISATANNSQCSIQPILIPPNDIVALEGDYQGKACTKLLVVYDYTANSYEIGGKITDRNRYDSNIHHFFLVKALFTSKNNFYFLTGSNTLRTYRYSFLNNCSFTIKYVSTDLAQDYLLKILYASSGVYSTGEPYLYGYREFNDETNSLIPVLNSNSSIIYNESPKSHVSLIGMIIIALILLGLVISGLIYMFCLRGAQTSDNRARKSKRSAKAKKSANSLIMKTLRSDPVTSLIKPESGVENLKSKTILPPPMSSMKSTKSPVAKLQSKKSSRSLKSPKSNMASKSPLTASKSTKISPLKSKSPLSPTKSKLSKSPKSSSKSPGFKSSKKI